jgi:hypothetical protein
MKDNGGTISFLVTEHFIMNTHNLNYKPLTIQILIKFNNFGQNTKVIFPIIIGSFVEDMKQGRGVLYLSNG